MTDITENAALQPAESAAPPPRRRSLVKRLLPLGVIAAGMAAAFALGLDEYLTFEALRENRSLLLGYVAAHEVLAVLVFIALYAAATSLSLPGGAALTIAGGFLFGSIAGTVWVVIGATLGATGIFLVAKTALGESLRRNAGPHLRKMEAGFRENALSYLLVLRLVPLFPFFVVNLMPALLGVPLRTYVIGTFFGIIPGTAVFAFVGAGLGSVFDANESFSPASILTPEVVGALVGLAALSLVPVVYKKVKARRQAA
ncbi:MAG: TVP38/TMEM64 family protein [Alphaproteobacteria bacterium]|nr:TVP38/TMEM64 family protein [Alphaproteobacteria bacterium]